MADTYQPNIYREQGGSAWVIRARDGGVIKGQSSATADPAQATGLADVSATATAATASGLNAVATRVNNMLTVFRNIGAVAT